MGATHIFFRGKTLLLMKNWWVLIIPPTLAASFVNACTSLSILQVSLQAKLTNQRQVYFKTARVCTLIQEQKPPPPEMTLQNDAVIQTFYYPQWVYFYLISIVYEAFILRLVQLNRLNTAHAFCFLVAGRQQTVRMIGWNCFNPPTIFCDWLIRFRQRAFIICIGSLGCLFTEKLHSRCYLICWHQTIKQNRGFPVGIIYSNGVHLFNYLK